MSKGKTYGIGVILSVVSFIALCKTNADDVVSFFLWAVGFAVGFALILSSYVGK